jgi:YkoY family integral membrane protein
MISGSDLLTVGMLVALEAMLSADNALVMAVIVLGLPRELQRKALHQGLIGAFTFRIAATFLAVHLIRLVWVKLLGGGYLMYLAYSHFSSASDEGGGHAVGKARSIFGLSVYWSTVVRLELVNLMFSIDSILVAVAMSRNTWVVVAGGLLGLVAMRLIATQILRLVERYPALVDGAFVIIAWVGIELSLEYFHAIGVIAYEIPKRVSLGLIAAIFVVSYLYARARGPVARADTLGDDAADLFAPKSRDGDGR